MQQLVADLVAEGVDATIPQTVRETVTAVEECFEERIDPITIAAVANKLNLDKSTAWRRVRVAIDRGYLKNQETQKGRPARLELGDPLPAEIEVLPAPAILEDCMVAVHSEGRDTPLPLATEASSSEELEPALHERLAIGYAGRNNAADFPGNFQI